MQKHLKAEGQIPRPDSRELTPLERHYPLHPEALAFYDIAGIQQTPALLRHRLHSDFKDPLLLRFNSLAKKKHIFIYDSLSPFSHTLQTPPVSVAPRCRTRIRNTRMLFTLTECTLVPADAVPLSRK